MFDIGFWELVMVGVVALIVVGPERLPALARTAGLWVAKARYFVSSVKSEINREIKSEELRHLLDARAQIPEFEDFVEETRQSLTESHDALRTMGKAPITPAVDLTSQFSNDSASDNTRDALPDDFDDDFPEDEDDDDVSNPDLATPLVPAHAESLTSVQTSAPEFKTNEPSQ
jgi:sec-independent protein translocase protein TatB